MILNVMFMAPTAIWVYGVWASVVYPGVHLPMTAILAMLISIPVGLFYALYSAVMPRTGGDYVWVSRTLHPAIGFMNSFFLFMVLLSVAGAYIPWFTQYALAPIFMALGKPGIAQFVSTNEFTFIMAAIYYIFTAIVVSRGSKATSIVLWIFFASVFIGLLVATGVALTTTPEQFAQAFAQKTGVSYNEILERAVENGFPNRFLMSATLMGLAFTYINFLGFNSSIYVGGELKDVKKGQIYAIVGAIILFGFIDWLAYQIVYSSMGGLFLGALSYLWIIEDPIYENLNMPFGPFFHFLFQYITNVSIYVFIVAAWSMMVLGAILTYIAITVRLVFAWSFDRVFPTKFAKVDARTGSPYVALIFVTIVAIICQILWIWTPLLEYFAYIVFGWMIMQSITAISGIILPYTKKELFEAAPEISKKKIANIPVIVVLGIITILLSIWIGYASMSPAMIGKIDPAILAFTFGLFGLGLLIYFISWLYHRKVGIPLELSFKEIPPL